MILILVMNRCQMGLRMRCLKVMSFEVSLKVFVIKSGLALF